MPKLLDVSNPPKGGEVPILPARFSVHGLKTTDPGRLARVATKADERSIIPRRRPDQRVSPRAGATEMPRGAGCRLGERASPQGLIRRRPLTTKAVGHGTRAGSARRRAPAFAGRSDRSIGRMKPWRHPRTCSRRRRSISTGPPPDMPGPRHMRTSRSGSRRSAWESAPQQSVARSHHRRYAMAGEHQTDERGITSFAASGHPAADSAGPCFVGDRAAVRRGWPGGRLCAGDGVGADKHLLRRPQRE